MKKLIAAILSLVIVATIALPAAAAQDRNWNYANQGSSRRYDDQRNRDRRSDDGDYRDNNYNQGQRAYNGDDDHNSWQKHRDNLTSAMGAGEGREHGQRNRWR